jgi:hypothetical protein
VNLEYGLNQPGEWLDEASYQLSAIASLGPGWDSYGAAPPSQNILEGAWTLLCSLAGLVPKPHIYPARSGGVQLEWELGPKYLEIELTSEREATFFYSDPSSRFETSGQLRQDESLDEVLMLIDGIYR